MAVIPNFPQNLLDEHHHWHSPSSHPGGGAGRQNPFGTAGAGLEFLQFHQTFMQSFRSWYDAQPFGTAPFNSAPFQNLASAQAAVAGWTSIPAPIKNGAVTGWGGVQVAQEARLTTFTPDFASADDLGAYIEGGIHGWIHGATASAFGDSVVATFHSPMSTFFYGIHGLVQHWWATWQASHKSAIKDIIDTKQRLKEFKEIEKRWFEKPPRLEKLEREKPFKEKDKDVFEGGGPGDVINPPFEVSEIERRMADLEVRFSQRAFIEPQERPMVGDIKHKK